MARAAEVTGERPRGLAPPSRAALISELLLPVDLARFAISWPVLIGAPRGDGHTVILLPGFRASERTMDPLLGFLRHLGYDVRHWGLGRNDGKVVAYANSLVRDLDARGGDAAPVTLIGWSLGGVVAREVARVAPARVRAVITMGTPVIGGPKYTSAARVYAAREGIDVDAVAHEAHRRALGGIDCPVTAIYTDRDGVVSPASSQDIYNSHTRMVKVDGGHLGLGFNPRVWRIIADTLAAD